MAFAMQKNIYAALLLLVAGGAIYATCRQDVIFLAPFRNSKWLELTHIDIQYSGNVFVYFLLFCLSDTLWYFALLLLQVQFYSGCLASKITFYFAVALPFVLELLQYLDVIYGTFDFIDLIFYLLTLLIFLLLCQKKFFYKSLQS